jgi:predicted CopG family antitoxin
MQEKENILRILQETKEALKNKDVFKLKELSNQTVHTASISQDRENITVAVFVYSLSKIIQRKEYQSPKKWNEFYKFIASQIDIVLEAIPKKSDEELRKIVAQVRAKIEKMFGDLQYYVQDVFRKAQINKASKIYEHGISMEQTSKLLGITLFELASYAGQRAEISNAPWGQTLDVKSRIKIAEDMFK